MRLTKELIEKARAAKTAEELVEIAKTENIELSAEDAENYFVRLNSEGELADEELDNVSGGGCDGDDNSTPEFNVGDKVKYNKIVDRIYAPGGSIPVYEPVETTVVSFEKHGSVYKYILADGTTVWENALTKA